MKHSQNKVYTAFYLQTGTVLLSSNAVSLHFLWVSPTSPGQICILAGTTAGMEGLGWQMDLMILEVSPNLTDSMTASTLPYPKHNTWKLRRWTYCRFTKRFMASAPMTNQKRMANTSKTTLHKASWQPHLWVYSYSHPSFILYGMEIQVVKKCLTVTS